MSSSASCSPSSSASWPAAVLYLIAVISGAMAASQGRAYRYPLTIRFVSWGRSAELVADDGIRQQPSPRREDHATDLQRAGIDQPVSGQPRRRKPARVVGDARGEALDESGLQQDTFDPARAGRGSLGATKALARRQPLGPGRGVLRVPPAGAANVAVSPGPTPTSPRRSSRDRCGRTASRRTPPSWRSRTSRTPRR